MAQRVGRDIALLFHDRGTRRGWVVSSTPRPHFTPGKNTVPILQEAGWAPGPVWTGGKSRRHRDSIPDRPARSQSLYRLSYRAHCLIIIKNKVYRQNLLKLIKFEFHADSFSEFLVSTCRRTARRELKVAETFFFCNFWVWMCQKEWFLKLYRQCVHVEIGCQWSVETADISVMQRRLRPKISDAVW